MNIEQMELPPDWEWSTMGEIADVVGGGTPKTNEPSNYEGGAIPWLTPADLSGYTAKTIGHGARYITQKGLDTSSAKMVPAGTVLFTSRAPIGYVAIASNPVCTNQGFKSFVLKDGVLPDYVYWWLKGSKDLAESMASGTTFLELSGAKAKQLPIPLAPLDQQKRIVAEIEKQFSRLDEAVANLKRVKANLKRYKAAVLKAAVEGRLVETEAEIARRAAQGSANVAGGRMPGATEGRSYETGEQLLQRILETRRSQWKGKGKYKEPATPDTTDLPELPEGWLYATIDQLLPPARDAMRTGPFGSLLKKHEHQQEGVPVLGIENIEAMQFVPGSKIHVSPEKAEELAGYAVTDGDVLISRSGTVGEVCVVPKELGEARISTNLMKVSLAKAGMLPAFFVMLFNGSPLVLGQVADLCKGSTRDFLNQEILRQLKFTCPPLHEQIRIIDEIERRFSLIGGIEAQVNVNFTRAERLRQSILAAAFSGQMLESASLRNHVAAELRDSQAGEARKNATA